MHEYRVTIHGLNEATVELSAEVLINTDLDDVPQWVSVQHWAVANPGLAGRERAVLLGQIAAEHGWSLTGDRRQPDKTGSLTVPAAPLDWETVLGHATELVRHYRRLETAWHTLIADTPLPVVRVGQIVGYGRHRIYDIQNAINGPRGRRRAKSVTDPD